MPVLVTAQVENQTKQLYAPTLPPGVRPKRKVVELHSLVTVEA
jgi:hypothetical protein